MKLQIMKWKHHISLAGDLISKGESAAAILITMTLSSAVQTGAYGVHIPIKALVDISVNSGSSHCYSERMF